MDAVIAGPIISVGVVAAGSLLGMWRQSAIVADSIRRQEKTNEQLTALLIQNERRIEQVEKQIMAHESACTERKEHTERRLRDLEGHGGFNNEFA